MTDSSGDARSGPGSGIRQPRRRGFLATLGAAGLAAASGLFATSRPALAANWGCCDLAYSPPNRSWDECQNSQYNYTWWCYTPGGGGLSCGCCEVYHGSAAYCWNT